MSKTWWYFVNFKYVKYEYDSRNIIYFQSILQKGPGGGELVIHQCRQCRRYSHTDNYYVYHDPESPSLLALCLKNIPALTSNHTHRSNNLSGLTLLDSMWIWTEPHSMRLKVRLTVRADVGESGRAVTVQQRLPVEFHVQWKMCRDCNREYTNRTWHALVQLRQKRQDESKKALVLVEMALAKNADIRKHVLNVDTSRNGFDFYFMENMHAQAFSSYLSNVYPMKIKYSQKLVSEDRRNNTANIKTTTFCDMVPLNRHDLIVCDKRAAKEGCSAGTLNGRMCLVNKVSSTLQLVDASPSRTSIDKCFGDLYPERYWKGGDKFYRIIFSEKRLIRFIVMDIELCDEDHDYKSGPPSDLSKKYSLADVIVCRESDFGVSDESFHCTTHLGNILEIGDTVEGYDLVSSVLTGGDEWSMNNSFNSSFILPDVVLVKKAKPRKEDDLHEEKGTSEPKSKSKSSASKRREKRKQRQEKKMKEISESLGRMGFGGEDNDDEDANWDTERKAFEKELEDDIELASEFQSIVERQGKLESTIEDEESVPDKNNDTKDT